MTDEDVLAKITADAEAEEAAEEALLAAHPALAEAIRVELDDWGITQLDSDPPHSWRCRRTHAAYGGPCHHNESLIAGLVRAALTGNPQ